MRIQSFHGGILIRDYMTNCQNCGILHNPYGILCHVDSALAALMPTGVGSWLKVTVYTFEFFNFVVSDGWVCPQSGKMTFWTINWFVFSVKGIIRRSMIETFVVPTIRLMTACTISFTLLVKLFSMCINMATGTLARKSCELLNLVFHVATSTVDLVVISY